ncbi:PhzF family phenazine biosynthesis protein [Anoxybacillus rupiensis]|uniref:PhzF family phenazine biosynthesis protein n=1 Tax=Anoxybacteroides rupiense TaxID=311460 RepID=A0ABD5IVX3_9BACL|nr:PhzF family phenazine biosynthesis protein [Anoxybacillus rupiensis]MBB3908213.1 putative PhzF superfamily epimerase YddE/YHI9 [Anoxybacillus rupiensis]MDE8563970.1 PhzF family phenazine biosynthesis protein [Anoxybacillus rupiensis]MED5052473.1 PhzF family phenazine biosynthesis protein [Anoxybacillus rupiensis]
MKQIPVYHVDSFTSEQFGGNPAGVVIAEERNALFPKEEKKLTDHK